MRIDDGGLSLQPRITSQNKPASNAPTNAIDAGKLGNSGLTSIDTNEIASLNELLANTANVREDLVNNIKNKIQLGDYLSDASVLKTATAILNL